MIQTDSVDDQLSRELEAAREAYQNAVHEYERVLEHASRLGIAEGLALLRKARIAEDEAAQRYQRADKALSQHRRGRRVMSA